MVQPALLLGSQYKPPTISCLTSSEPLLLKSWVYSKGCCENEIYLGAFWKSSSCLQKWNQNPKEAKNMSMFSYDTTLLIFLDHEEWKQRQQMTVLLYVANSFLNNLSHLLPPEIPDMRYSNVLTSLPSCKSHSILNCFSQQILFSTLFPIFLDCFFCWFYSVLILLKDTA